MGIFDKIKDALGNNQHDDATPAKDDVPFDPTLDQPTSDSAQATAPADSTTPADAEVPSADPVIPTDESSAGADVGSVLSGQSSEHSMEPATQDVAQPAAPAVEPAQPAPAPEPAAAPAAAEPTTYTVVEGDNLTWIGERYGVSVDDLVAANNIENPDLIFPGQVLTIPR